jgi:serine protease Do
MFVRHRAFVCTHRRTCLFVLSLISSAAMNTHLSAQVVLRAEAEQAAPAPANGETLVSHIDRDYEYHQLGQEASILERQLNLVRRIVRLASPTVVHIEASKKSEAGPGLASSRVDEAGAGVIVSIRNQLFVLTNRHVVYPAEPSAIRIELSDGRHLRPIKIWADPSTDVAVMQIDGKELVSARLGDSDKMEMGDFVLAVGSPFGLSHSVTYGILSAKGRRNLELGSREIEIQDFFQTDAAINPGNSGGPLLNLRGEVIGINTAIASNSGGNEGIGFTIPINMAMLVADQLITRGRLQRAYLGVQLENGFNGSTARQLGLPSNEGALVKAIIPNSPAEKAGLRVGDVVVEFDGTRIENDGHLVKTVGLTPLGKQVDMVIYRNHNRSQVSIMLEPSPEN